MLQKWIKFGIEELKFIRSFNDARIFYDQKIPFLLPKIKGNYLRITEVPLSLQIEPTNFCMLNCICCPNSKMKRKKGHMNYDLFKKIINESADIGVKRIHMYLHGEPLMHPNIIDMIQYIKSKKLGFTMATNAMLLSKQMIKNILNAGVNSGDYITVSMLGSSKEVHERIMKNVSHEKVMEGIKDFIKLRKENHINGPVIEVIFYRMKENIHEEKQFVNKWQGVVDHVHPIGTISKSFSDYGKHKINNVRDRTCKLLWERMAIYWNGEVTVCAEDVDGEHVMGDLNNMSIRELWNSKEMLFIKRLHVEKNYNKFKLCSVCDQ